MKKSDEVLKSLEELEALGKSMLGETSDDPADDLSKGEKEEEKEELNADDVADEGGEEDNSSDDDDDKEDDDASDDGGEEDIDDDIEKSIQELFGVEDIQKGMEVSDFLASLVEASANSVLMVGDEVKKSLNQSTVLTEGFAKSMGIIAKSQAALYKSLGEVSDLVKSVITNQEALAERLEAIESQPTMRKSVGSLNVQPKNFQKSVGAVGDGQQLSKSQITAALSDLVMKGDSNISPVDVLHAESGAPLRPEVMAKVQQYYKQ